jgi:hypothetical protein
VRKVNTSGTISTIAGTGSCFISGDGGPASVARLQYPFGVACDGLGNVYIADDGNNRIRKINSAGIISTIAGSPTFGFSGDGGPSTAAKLYYPQAVATDPAGNVYISDVNNNRIRMINTSGVINTIIGDGIEGFAGDGGDPLLAEIARSTGIAVDASGKIYIADNNNHRIRYVHVPSHAPYFTAGHSQNVTYCSTEIIYIDTLLKVFDVDAGQTETWSVITAPVHGILSSGYSTTSTGTVLTPTGMNYQPLGYIGNDSFKIRIDDGFFSDTTTVYISIVSPLIAGSISGIDSLCPGDTLSFTATVSGGTWNSSNGSVASVSVSGLVTAVGPGANVITYTVTNACGTAVASFPFRVSAYCSDKVTNVSAGPGKLSIFPNPGDGAITVMLSAPQNEDVHVTVTNMPGRQVAEFDMVTNEPNSVTLNVAPGIYILSAVSTHGKYIGKIIVK